jgi:spermidine synthase
MKSKVLRTGLLLLGSGLSALVYQIAWMREFRLVFGASTAATAAVMAIFMGGLGLGGAILGKKVDRSKNPLRFYAFLELGIAGFAALTPVLIYLSRELYLMLGGTVVMGLTLSTIVRLILSTIVLAIPTFLMGGTLPAAARAAEDSSDVGRRNMALLYGLNTIGAVVGVSLATFLLLESLGTTTMLLVACVFNALVAGTAWLISLSKESQIPDAEIKEVKEEKEKFNLDFNSVFVFSAAAIVGFVFFLMELVWYRMLTPLLGGSTYTFGLILAVALFGIGVGGAICSMRGAAKRATMVTFAVTCLLEAVFIAIPFAMGDTLAHLAGSLISLNAFGMAGRIISWSITTSIVVLPAAIVAGYQFPVLISLLGKGRDDVGQHIGFAYAWNTVGSIVGSLAGGFLLLPLLTALGSWVAVIILLSILGVVSTFIHFTREKSIPAFVIPLAICAIALALTLFKGPTAFWRHTPIGVGLVNIASMDMNEIRDFRNMNNRNLIWEADGVESAIGLNVGDGISFIVNGKSDGNARLDAGTQIGLGMISALLHPKPESAFVIGLGTGSTAGWIADVPTMKKVDVVEIEPKTFDVARMSTPVNRNVMENPKVNNIIADGREVLITSPEKYDLVISEPSNPYRAGIASLFTKEFYDSVKMRMSEGAIFSQWVQGYMVDTQTVRTIYTTLHSVFPYIEAWQAGPGDMVFICSMEKVKYSVPELRSRFEQATFKEAFMYSWGVTDLDGFMGHYLANQKMADLVAEQEMKNNRLNTDDRMLIEFGFARAAGTKNVFNLLDFRKVSAELGFNRPEISEGEIDWGKAMNGYYLTYKDSTLGSVMAENKQDEAKANAYLAFHKGDFDNVLRNWLATELEPTYPMENIMVGEALASQGNEKAIAFALDLKDTFPADAAFILARYYYVTGDLEKSITYMEGGFKAVRVTPWAYRQVISRSLNLLSEIVGKENRYATRAFQAISQPFSVYVQDGARQRALMILAAELPVEGAAALINSIEPYVFYNEKMLDFREKVYKATNNKHHPRALRDLETFHRDMPKFFSRSVKGE